jgi:hypothetical protein
LRFALFALVASFFFLVVICCTLSHPADYAALLLRLLNSSIAWRFMVLGARCSPFAWLPQPEKGKCNNQQDDPKSIFQLLQAWTSLRVRAFS